MAAGAAACSGSVSLSASSGSCAAGLSSVARIKERRSRKSPPSPGVAPAAGSDAGGIAAASSSAAGRGAMVTRRKVHAPCRLPRAQFQRLTKAGDYEILAKPLGVTGFWRSRWPRHLSYRALLREF